MRAACVTVCVIWCATASAQQKPDFSGEWILNRAASTLQAESAAVESGVARVEHRDPEFRFTRVFTVKQQPLETSYEITTDGKELSRANGPVVSRSRLEWQGNSLLLTALITTPRGEVSNIVRYELLDGGKMLRAVEDLGGAAPVHHNVWMFDRR